MWEVDGAVDNGRTAGCDIRRGVRGRHGDFRAGTGTRPALSRKEQRQQAQHYLQLVGIEEFAGQLPTQLSQGTQQRVAIARALSLEPRFLLLDEPFGMLDSITRFELQDLILDLWEHDRRTVVLVTHDVDEAIYLSDRIILMTDGPEARVGLELPITLPRPRDRGSVSNSAEYYRLRAEVIGFLEHHSRQFAEKAA